MENVHTGFNNIQILDYHISQGEAFSFYQPLLLKGKQVYNDRCSLQACSIYYNSLPWILLDSVGSYIINKILN